MKQTLRLLGNAGAFLFRHPIVLLPALVARLMDFVISLGLVAARGPVLRAVAPHSVLGGISGGVNGPVLFLGTLLSWMPILLQTVLFLYGMAVCARWAHTVRQGEQAPVRSWQVGAGRLTRTAALTFFVSTLTVGVGTYLSLRGGVPVRWAPLVTGCFLIMADWFVVPAWLRLVADEQGSRKRELPRVPAFVAVVIGVVVSALLLLLASTVQQRVLQTSLKPHPIAVGFWINLAGAALASVALAFSFVALSRYAADRPDWPVDERDADA